MNLSYPGLTVRPIGPEDRGVLFEIYSDTRKEELEQVTYWPAAMKSIFLEQQFSAQHTYYQENYPQAFFWLLCFENETVGRLYLSMTEGSRKFHIIDIAILSGWRNKGIGESIFRDIMERAAGQNCVVTIHVEVFNRARKLYERLGFRQEGETDGVYILMKWEPNN